ncbi:MAG: hypothetical protein K8R39_04245 [Arcobacteraceae bacterium]|nr:hypothetical protein [Arcobacteraceae bacterium]
MSKNTCSKRGCEHEKYKDDKYCILHCDKKDFEESDINSFWKQVRQEYPYNNKQELIIENVNFPKFESHNYYSYSYFYDRSFHYNVQFLNCIFFNDFSADNERFNNGITFEKCIFYGKINFQYSSLLELINCEFKNEFKFDNIDCRKLEVKDSKFIKECHIKLQYDITIDENSIFRAKTYLGGTGNNTLTCKNSQFDKELQIDNIHEVNIDTLELKSDISFLTSSFEVNLYNTHFPKNITFERLSNLQLENIKLNDLKFTTLENFKVNNCEHLCKLEFTQTLQNLTIQNSTLKKEIKSTDIKEINFDQVEFNEDINFIGIHNDINMNKCIFNKLRINTTHTININESKFENLELFGDKYEKIDFKNVKIKNTFEVNNVNDISLKKLETSSLKSIGQVTGNFKINDFKIENILFESKEYDKIDIGLGFIECNLNFNSNNNIKKILLASYKIELLNLTTKNIEEMVVDTSYIKKVKLKSDTNSLLHFKNSNIEDFIDIELKNSKDLIFNMINLNPTIKITSNEYANINILESKLKSLYINAYEYLEEKEHYNNGIVMLTNSIIRDNLIIPNIKNLSSTNNEFYGKVNISKVAGILELQYCIFKGEVDFSQGVFNHISIKSSTFKKKLDFLSSQISKINIIGHDLHCEFKSQVKFDNCKIADISVLNSDFDDKISFNNIENITLSNIQSTKIEKLNICNSNIFNLFYSAELLSINEFLLDTVKLSSTNSDNDIDIERIDINELKCNKLTIQNDLNFNEMKINKFRIANSNVEKVFRIRYSKINNIFFTDTTFEDLQIIENKNDKFEEQREFRLRNTTIKSTVLDKLKLDNFNMSDAHVSDAKIGYVKFKKGSRETNRFFKNYYDSISDYIKANQYYKDEMEEQYNTTKKYGSEWWVLFFNKWISDFGQSWINPLLYILGITIAIFIMVNFSEFRQENYVLTHKLLIWNNYWEFLNPFSKNANEKYKSWYGLWMIHKLILTVLIYHFVVAIKRKTKR